MQHLQVQQTDMVITIMEEAAGGADMAAEAGSGSMAGNCSVG